MKRSDDGRDVSMLFHPGEYPGSSVLYNDMGDRVYLLTYCNEWFICNNKETCFKKN